MKIIFLVLSVFIAFVITFDLFLKEPPVWPDEASLIQISSIYSKSLTEGFRQYPSLYTPLLNQVFNITGASIETQRLLSLFAGFISIIIFTLFAFKIARDFRINSTLTAMLLTVMITDFTFLQGTRAGRPEIFTLLFGLVSSYLLYKYTFDECRSLSLLALSFLFALIAALFHANGIIYLVSIIFLVVIIFKNINKKDQNIILLSAVFISALVAFIGLNLLPTFLSIVKRIAISNAQGSWLFTVFSIKPLELKIIYSSFIVVTVLFFWYLKRNLSLLTIGLPLLFSWIILLFNKDFWYAIFLVPLTFLALLVLLGDSYNQWIQMKSNATKYKFCFLVFISLMIFSSNLKFHINILALEGGDRYSYQKFIQDITNTIPENKTVFTSAIPDPYYAFIGRNNIIKRFPQAFVERSYYLEELNQTDYIIYNGPYGDNYYGNLVMEYFNKNMLKTTEIGQSGQYQALVVELKPRNQRVNP